MNGDPQRFKCPNIVRFDKERQEYVYCDHIFTVDGTNSGTVVECPTCGGEVRLGSVDLSRAGTFMEEDAPGTSQDHDPRSRGTDPPQVPPAKSSGGDAELDVSGQDDRLAGPADAVDGDDSLSPPADPFHGEFDDADFQTSMAPGASSSQHGEPADSPSLPGPVPSFHGTHLQMASYCPSCGGPLPSEQVLCGRCGFHKKLQRRIPSGQPSDADAPPELRGFQLWLKNNLAEGESIQGLLVLVGVFFLVVLIGLMVGTFRAYGFWAVLFLPPLLLVIVLMLNVIAAGDSSKTAGVAGFVQRTLWTMLLRFCRLTRWQVCSWPPGTTIVLTRRDGRFSDDDLLQVDDLDQIRVVDLEGTGVSDEGLLYLTAFPQLGFIVLRHTSASDAGIDRLQNALPAAWIWR